MGRATPLSIMLRAAQAPYRAGPLSSNVMPHTTAAVRGSRALWPAASAHRNPAASSCGLRGGSNKARSLNSPSCLVRNSQRLAGHAATQAAPRLRLMKLLRLLCCEPKQALPWQGARTDAHSGGDSVRHNPSLKRGPRTASRLGRAAPVVYPAPRGPSVFPRRSA